MPKTTSHAPGTFCWIELATADGQAAKSFYTSLFGWTVVEHDMGPGGIYFVFQKDGADTGAMYQIPPDMKGMPPNWLSYVAVADADAASGKAKGLGGSVISGPFDVMDKGRMAVIEDPQGATFAIWQARSHAGVCVRDEPGSLCWNELQARDLDKARAFYAPLFDWRLKESPEYTEMHAGDTAVGGMMLSQGPAEVPSHWLPYFAVEDCEATVARLQSLGGQVYAGPFDVPGVGRMAVAADPQGAAFSVIKLELGSH
jgi:predicted enzyme related to lactoylglutathione lyase